MTAKILRHKKFKYVEKQDVIKHLLFKHSEGFLQRLDDWRASRRPILSRSAAIKLMCEERMAKDSQARSSDEGTPAPGESEIVANGQTKSPLNPTVRGARG